MNLGTPSSVSPRLPSAGPILVTIPGISDVVIAASTVGPEVFYRWPGPYTVGAFFLWEETVATPAIVAGLRLRMQDDSEEELIADGSGEVDSAGSLAFVGRSPRWQPLRRVIRPGQKWLFQIENTNVVDCTPQLYFRVEQ